MKKYKNLVSVVMSIVLILGFVVPVSAVEISKNSVSNNYKIDSELESVINNATDNEKIAVALWLTDVNSEERSETFSTKVKSAEIAGELLSTYQKAIDLSVLKSATLTNEEVSEQAQTLVEIKRNVEKELHSNNNTNVLNSLTSSYDVDKEPVFVSKYAPLVIMDMTKNEITQVVNNQSIENIYYYEPNTLLEEDLESASDVSLIEEETESSSIPEIDRNLYPYGVWQNISNINVLRDAMGYTGLGVKIGLLDFSSANFDYEGINEDVRARLYEQFAYHIENDLLHFSDYQFTDDNGNHGNYMLSILSGFASDYEGVAPLAEIYCDGYYERPEYFFTPTEKMIDNGVNIISASIGWGYYNNGYDYITKYFDYLVSNSEITLCISSGNTTNTNNVVYEPLSSALAYNTITVGDIDDRKTADKSDDIRKSTSRYNGATNGIYKPDICAPGARVATYVVPDKIDAGNGGTSAACPVVSGICALLMEAIPTLKTDPMLVKSLLMSSAYELDTAEDIYSTPTSTELALTRDCGPGMIDAYSAYMTYTNGNYRSYSSNGTTINHAVYVSQKELNAGKDIFIGLNWEQWNTVDGESWTNESNYNILNGFHHTLSLYDPNGVLVAVSDYQYDRKQFIRYKPLQVGRYTAKITRSYTDTPVYYPSFAVAHCIK